MRLKLLSFKFTVNCLLLMVVSCVSLNSCANNEEQVADENLKFLTLADYLKSNNYDSIVELEIDGANFNGLPNDIYKLQNIQTLKLINFKTAGISAEFSKLNKLEYLTIKYDSSIVPSANIFLPSLHYLEITESETEEIPSTISNAVQLENIMVSKTKLNKISNELWSLKQLKVLNLNEGNLKELNVDELPPLLSAIYVQSNQLTELPKIFSSNQLLEVSVFGNKISTIPSDFKLGAQINTIDLGKNQIKSLPKDFITDNITFLGIAFNQIESMPEELYSKSFQTLQLEGNPFNNCDPSKFMHKDVLNVISLNKENIQTLKVNAFDGYTNLTVGSSEEKYQGFSNKNVRFIKTISQ